MKPETDEINLQALLPFYFLVMSPLCLPTLLYLTSPLPPLSALNFSVPDPDPWDPNV